MENNLQKRIFEFVTEVILFLRTLPDSQEYKVVKYQLIKAASSTGANYEEAQAASSKADFTYKTEISLKEMRESNYWLRLIRAISKELNTDDEKLDYLITESGELKLILGSIVSKTKRNK
ncbi:four helix bundle protein [uncultured Draconibacterium sp.]|uniref:four helix bundle protein n=1 Tax=uncultured Draconibacterium sp. TaxID=1573823 RepID=UPI0029C7E064|nr:four helix bundle protein [uncultured Draconibacterium sp.]